MDLETRDWLRRRWAAERAEYWEPRARGVEVAAQAGWYFTGRRAALAELTRWLRDPRADTGLRVLTGDPGSGKSAVLARLVTLADPGPAPKLPGDASDPAFVPPAGSVTAALLAKGKTAGELIRELAVGLDIAPGDIAPGAELPAELLEREAFTVVIDALDEASNPAAVIENVIVPLHSAASPGRGPRLLVATRKYQHLLRALPTAQVVIDLDQDAYHDEADISGYVAKVLLAVSDPDSPTPYRGHPELAAAVAEQVAAIAGHSFLIAQIAARYLVRTSPALDPAQVSTDHEQWSDVGAAFDRDLDRYGGQAYRVRDLLTPLAWAEGSGLPRELWAPLATALATDQDYTEEDITWLIEQAGFYVVETLDGDRSVYRLYHEQFARHLRAAPIPAAQRDITAELLRRVPATAGGRREWLAATPYIRTHLATHASKGLILDILDQLVNDPGFLLAADPTRLLPALATITSPEVRNSASAFESVRYLLAGRPLGQAAAQLDLAARVHNAGPLIDGISKLPYARPWTIAWGHWTRPDRHVLLGRHATEVRTMATATLNGVPVAVSGSQDGQIQVWDLRAGSARSGPLRGHTGEVTALAVGDVDGTPVAVSSGLDGTVRLWDLRAGRALSVPLGGYNGEVTALAVGDVDGTPVAVSSGGGALQMWDLRTGTTRTTPLPDRRFVVTALAVGEVEGTPVAVGSSGGRVRVWDLKTGVPRRRPLRIGLHAVTALAVSGVDGTPVAVGSLSDGKVLMWNLKTGEAHRRYTGWVAALAVGEVDGISVVVSGGLDGTVRLWDLRALWKRPAEAARGAPLRGHTGMVTALAAAEVDGTPVAVSGGRDGTVRLWNLRAGAARGAPPSYPTEIAALAAGEVDGTPVAVSGGHDATVRLWDLHTGAAHEKPLYPGRVRRLLPLPRNTWLFLPVAVGKVTGTPVAVSSIYSTMRVWDLKTGVPRRRPLRIRLSAALRIRLPAAALAVSEVDGIPVAVSGGLDGTMQVWDLREGKARGEPLRRHNFGVAALAVAEVDGTPVAVSGGLDGTVRVWDLREGKARGAPLLGHSGGVTALAVAEVDGTPVAVSGGLDGTVRVWDLREGKARGEPLRGHAAKVTALAVWQVDGTPVTVSGDDSGAISLWRGFERRHYALATLDAPAGVEAIACGGQAGCLVATKDGSLFSLEANTDILTRAK